MRQYHQLSSWSSLEGCIFLLSILRGVIFLTGINFAIAVSTFIVTGGPDIAAGFLILEAGGPDIVVDDSASAFLTGCNCLTGVNDAVFCCCGFIVLFIAF